MPYSIQFLPGHRAREVEVELVFGVVDALGRLLGLRRLRLLRLKKRSHEIRAQFEATCDMMPSAFLGFEAINIGVVSSPRRKGMESMSLWQRNRNSSSPLSCIHTPVSWARAWRRWR